MNWNCTEKPAEPRYLLLYAYKRLGLDDGCFENWARTADEAKLVADALRYAGAVVDVWYQCGDENAGDVFLPTLSDDWRKHYHVDMMED